MSCQRLASVLALLLAAISPARAQYEEIDSPMYRSPELSGPPTVRVFPDGLQEIWLRALSRPEAEMRLKAAATIALAHDRGVKGLDATVGPLIAALDAPEKHPAVRLEIARTLVALDARDAASSLFAQLESASIELRELIEPALARWDHRPARKVWLDRLVHATPPRSLTLAIEGLATVREEKAVAPLWQLASNRNVASSIRLDAARALGAIRDKGLESDAGSRRAESSSLIDRMAAALMLRRHGGPAAIAILRRLARDPQAAVVAIAAARLIDIDPKLGLALAVPGGPAEPLRESADPEVRLLHVEMVFRLPSVEHVASLADVLPDPHPDVRIKARQHLKTLAEQKELRQAVLDKTSKVLAANDWRGLEQAAILLAQLDHRPAASRLAQLLIHDRPEAFVTAAWALRRLAVPAADVPDVYEAVTRYVDGEMKRVAGGQPPPPGRRPYVDMIDHQLSQLNQLLGKQKYQPADKVLRKFIAKRMGLTEGRAAAIWALGLIHEGKQPDAALVTALVARLEDVTSIPPEMPPVRRMSAVTLGRMKADAALPTLRRFWPGVTTNTATANACGWAIEQITGEKMPPGEPVRRGRLDWFLLPVPK